jgi:hypothetical protein
MNTKRKILKANWGKRHHERKQRHGDSIFLEENNASWKISEKIHPNTHHQVNISHKNLKLK